MGKIPPIFLKLFTPNTLGCYGLGFQNSSFSIKHLDDENKSLFHLKARRSVDLSSHCLQKPNVTFFLSLFAELFPIGI